MIHYQYWTTFWKQLLGMPRASGKPDMLAEGESAQGKFAYLSRYGTQILFLLSSEGASFVSPNVAALMGHSPASCRGGKFFTLVHEDYLGRLGELIENAASGGGTRHLRCKLRNADGAWQWHLLTIQPGDDAGEVVCIASNIHEGMLTQNTLQRARLEAELALRSRSEFFSNMSHDLRTPLNAVIGFSQIIESEMFGRLESPQYREYIKHIQQSGYDLLAKIEDLLEIANIDAGRVTLEREIVTAESLLRAICEACRHHASAARVELRCDLPQPELALNVDRSKLQHILGHLIANALRFTPAGGAVTLRVAGQNGGAAVSVEDNGAGMTDEKRADVEHALQEEIGWTEHSARGHGAAGIGLGLALTREFTGLHGGRMRFESAPGAGTCVTLMLPAECVAESGRLLRQAAN